MSRYVLSFKTGLTQLWGHDNSVVVFEDGDLLFGAEDERFSRDKHGSLEFPEAAIRSALDHCGLTLADVDEVVVPYDPDLEWKRFTIYAERFGEANDGLLSKLARGRDVLEHLVTFRFLLRRRIESELEAIGDEVPRIETMPHHRAHAASAFYPSGFDEALVLSVDGFGEYDSTVVWRADGDGLSRVRTYDMPNSLGMFYATFTNYLGYRILNGEGKVMGLAAYGRENPDIESALRDAVDVGVDYDVTAITGGITKPSCLQRLEDVVGRPARDDREEFTQWEKDLAHAAQTLLEETVTDIVSTYCERLGVGRVALAGGIGLNCKLNKRLLELPAVEELFVQPVASDAGTPLGAGMARHDPDDVAAMSNVYWGPDYPRGEVEATLRKYKLDYAEPDDLARAVAERLADGQLVGWFQGRMEMGPRALGHRSILADPRTAESRDRVNDEVKNREWWRPFAPSILEERVDEYLENAEPAPYMIKTFDVRPDRRDEIPAVLHPGDHTTRPQTVRREDSPRYYDLLRAFEELTGVPVVLNTSFNDSGEPIVNTPREAVRDFYSMGLDALAVSDFLVEK